MRPALEFRRLAVTDLVDGFEAIPSIGAGILTTFFRKHALKNQERRRSATWLAVDTEAQRIAGYVTLCPGSAEAEPLKRLDPTLPGYPASVMVLAKMATHADYAGCDVGRRLMADVVMKRAEHLAAEHACIGVYVDAKSGAVGFYAKMDFVSLAPEREEGDPRRTTPMFRLLK